MKKGCSIGVFVLGIVMLCASAAITVLGAVGMGRRAAEPHGPCFSGKMSRKNG